MMIGGDSLDNSAAQKSASHTGARELEMKGEDVGEAELGAESTRQGKQKKASVARMEGRFAYLVFIK